MTEAPVTTQTTVDTGGAQLAVGEQSDFDRAKAALDAGEFQTAADQFATFTQTYTGGPLSAEAHFFRGDALEKLGDIRPAARAYLDSFSSAPNGPKAPDALYKVGTTLGALGQTADACQMFAAGRHTLPDRKRGDRGADLNAKSGLFVSESALAGIVGGALHSALGRNPKHIGVALSGGGDSTALLVALHEVLAGQCQISAATVDHGFAG